MSVVYFIKPVGFDGPIKVGFSVRGDARRGALESMSPFPLELLAEIPGDRRLEGRFHAYLADTHQRREWFSVSARLLCAIEAINAGTFDRSILPEKPFSISACRNGRRRRLTEEQKLRIRLNNRMRRRSRETGYAIPEKAHLWTNDMKDPAVMAAVEGYLAAPHAVGVPISSQWAAERRATYHANSTPNAGTA